MLRNDEVAGGLDVFQAAIKDFLYHLHHCPSQKICNHCEIVSKSVGRVEFSVARLMDKGDVITAETKAAAFCISFVSSFIIH